MNWHNRFKRKIKNKGQALQPIQMEGILKTNHYENQTKSKSN